MKKKILAIGLLIALTLSGCNSQSVNNDNSQTVGGNNAPKVTGSGAIEVSPLDNIKETVGNIKDKVTNTKTEEVDTSQIKEATNTFNWKLFSQLNTEDNQFYSALSLEQALGIALIGSKEQTRDEILNLLNITDEEKFFEQSQVLVNRIAPYSLANGIWINSLYKKELNDTYEEDFFNPAKDYFDANVTIEAFIDNDVKTEIKDFVSKKTNGFIDNYNSEVDNSSSINIINAIYFKDNWETPFEANDTYNDIFYGKDSESEVEFMHMYDERYKLFEDDSTSLRILEIPYKEDEVMDIFLSEEENTVDVLNRLSIEEKNYLIDQIDSSRKIEIDLLALPKFEESTKIEDLNNILKSMGLITAYTKDANFENIGDFYISEVFHQAKIRVDEEGTEAAAVSEIIMDKAAAPSFKERIEFVIDKPFVYVIRDTKTGVILFTGTIQNLE